MKPTSRFLLSVSVIIALLSSIASADAQDARRPKKLIEVGWDMPTSVQLPGILEQAEKQPFDGIVVQAIGRKDDGKDISLGWAFLNEKWKREWFQPSIDQLKSCKFKRLNDNFLIFNANPGNVDWFDDAGWKNIVEHWRIAAWVAKQSGFKGICFDPEPYSQPSSQFLYSAQPERDKHTFAEYCVKARQRGREVMQAVAEEYPTITILSFFLNSVTFQAAGQADPQPALAPSGYGLLPSLLDGWLDVAPPTLTVVDGHESSYTYNSRAAFLEAGNMIRNGCQNLVSPENRAKYRAQIQTGFGIYLDAYSNPKESPWYIDGKGGPRVDRLRANVSDALSVADEYVWIYGEKYRWWPTTNGSVKPEQWPEALPGCSYALGIARDPMDFARTEIAKQRASGKAVNLAHNGNFNAEKAASFEGAEVAYREGGNPAGWGSWQDEKSKGVFAWDRQTSAPGNPAGAARMSGMANGCFIQAFRVQPGERYAVSALQRIQGKGHGAVNVRWQTADGKWTCEVHDIFIYPQTVANPASPAWAELFGAVQVPADVGRMVVLLGAAEQPAASDVIWYDNVEVFKLP